MMSDVVHAVPRCVRQAVLLVGLTAGIMAFASGCREDALKQSSAGEATGAPGNLLPSQAAMVLAKVGDDPITLGDFASTLERMDGFDRLRYQTPERRRELLDHMITVQLLAREAQRRGMDKDPELQEAYRQILRDTILADVRKGVREPAAIPEAEVRAYYDSHLADYQEPERRRITHIMVSDKQAADKLLADAKKATSAEWGSLVGKHSQDAAAKDYKGPSEFAGDLGFIGPPSDTKGSNPRVPEELRAAAFDIASAGSVLDRPVVDSQGKWHIIRLIARTDPHTRPFAEAERMIRVTMAQQDIQSREKALEDELRKKYPVTIDDGALSDVKIPAPSVQPNSNDGRKSPHGPH